MAAFPLRICSKPGLGNCVRKMRINRSILLIDGVSLADCHVERELDTSRKEKHWGRRKLARDQ